MVEYPGLPGYRGKVLLPIGDGTEVMDTLYPLFRLREEGFEVVVAGPKARLYHGVLHEIPPEPGVPWDITREQPAYHVRATIAFAEVKSEEYAGLFLSGGRAPEYLRYDSHLLAVTRHFFETAKPVAMVCHGVEIAAAARCQVRSRYHRLWRLLCRCPGGGGWQSGQRAHLARQRQPHATVHQASEECKIIQHNSRW